jgi:phosphate/sulfate permease
MGVITLALIANGNLHKGSGVPHWVVIDAATPIALGTYSGGWRIIKTMGSRIIKMDPAQGFAAQTSGAATVLAASHFGYPLSTTHVINGGVIGAGAAKRLSDPASLGIVHGGFIFGGSMTSRWSRSQAGRSPSSVASAGPSRRGTQLTRASGAGRTSGTGRGS